MIAWVVKIEINTHKSAGILGSCKLVYSPHTVSALSHMHLSTEVKQGYRGMNLLD